MGYWKNFTILQTCFPRSISRVRPHYSEAFPGSDKMDNPSSMFVVSCSVGERVWKSLREKAMGYSSHLSSASEDIFRMSESKHM